MYIYINYTHHICIIIIYFNFCIFIHMYTYIPFIDLIRLIASAACRWGIAIAQSMFRSLYRPWGIFGTGDQGGQLKHRSREHLTICKTICKYSVLRAIGGFRVHEGKTAELAVLESWSRLCSRLHWLSFLRRGVADHFSILSALVPLMCPWCAPVSSDVFL